MQISTNFHEMVKYAVYVYHHVAQGKPIINAKFEDSLGTPHKVALLCVNDYNKKPETYYGVVWLENNLGNRTYERRFELDILDRRIKSEELSRLFDMYS